MQGFQPAARRLAQLPQQPQHQADGGAVGFGAHGLAGLRQVIPQVQAMGYPQAAAAPAAEGRAAALRAMIPQVEAMGYRQASAGQPQYFAEGGVVRGPGTGTSDSIEDEVPPGTFIMPADSTAAIGPSALERMGTVPVRLSNGEFEVPPEQVMAIGAAVLKAMKDATHAPVNGVDGGQTDDEVAQAQGFSPSAAQRMQEMPEQLFADGGLVDPARRPTSFGDAAAVAGDPSTTQVRTSAADTYGRAPAPAPAAPAPAMGSNLAAATRMGSFTDPRSTLYDSNPYAAANSDKLAAAGQSSRATVEAGMPPPPAPVTARNSFGDAAAATVDAGVTQVAGGYQPGRGTVSTVPSQPLSARAPVPAAPAVAAAAQPGAGFQTAAQRMAAAPAPAPAAPMGWADRNARRNLEVSASSIMDSPARRAAQAALAPPPPAAAAAAPAPALSTAAAPAPTAGGFQTAAQRMAAQRPQRFADGGLVDDERERRLNQIPTGGNMPPPQADGSQQNPLNTELGRNAVNTLSALPGAGGLASRGGTTAARAATGGAVSAERVIPAAWEVVQEGGSLASRAGSAAQQMGQIGGSTGGALSRAASMVPPQAAPALAAPGGQVARVGGQTAQQVAGFSPGTAARGATEFVERVPDAALAMSNTAQAAAPAGAAAGRGFGRYAATGTAGLAGAAALTGATNDSTAAQMQPGAAVQTSPGAPGLVAPAAVAPTQATATAAAPAITRDGSSYSGPANLSGDVPIRNADGSVRNGGAISAQNMAAADVLGARQAQESATRVLGQMPAGFQPAVQPPTVLHSGNDWQSRNDLRNLQVSASSITNNGGRFDPTGGKNPAALAYQTALAADAAARGAVPKLAGEAMQETGANNRTLLKEAGDIQRENIRAQGLTLKAVIDARKSGQAPTGYQWAPGGGLTHIPGGPADPSVRGNRAPLNDTQSKALQFGTRMQEAGSILDRMSAAGVNQPGLIKRAADTVGLGAAANFTQSAEQQQVEQAQRDFINAVLRRESGAAIADSEFSNANKQYFIQPGDSPEVQAQKRRNREIATAGILAEVPDSEKRVSQVLTNASASQPTAAQPAGGAIAVTDAESYAAIPAGSLYTTPSGEVRRKK